MIFEYLGKLIDWYAARYRNVHVDPKNCWKYY